MKFTKMHGAGNDYVYINATEQERDWTSLAIAMSNRHTGIGSDGIILAMPSDRAHLRMKMFNADGSEGTMCGNGIRCIVAFAQEVGLVTSTASPVVVETSVGNRLVTPERGNSGIVSAEVDMGEPIFAASQIPVNIPGSKEIIKDYPLHVNCETFEINCVSMGNPHAVTFINTPVDEIPLEQIGPLVENHPMFPQRVNFEIVNRVDQGRVRARVWERGSGLTRACGTGACAIAVIGRMSGLTNSQLTVSLPGGDLEVYWPGQGNVILKGPVIKIFEGEWPE